jgi:hypothetical protein
MWFKQPSYLKEVGQLYHLQFFMFLMVHFQILNECIIYVFFLHFTDSHSAITTMATFSSIQLYTLTI